MEEEKKARSGRDMGSGASVRRALLYIGLGVCARGYCFRLVRHLTCPAESVSETDSVVLVWGPGDRRSFLFFYLAVSQSLLSSPCCAFFVSFFSLSVIFIPQAAFSVFMFVVCFILALTFPVCAYHFLRIAENTRRVVCSLFFLILLFVAYCFVFVLVSFLLKIYPVFTSGAFFYFVIFSHASGKRTF